MPISNEDAAMLGFDTLIAGLKLVRVLGVSNFSQELYDRELAQMQHRKLVEQGRMSLRSKLLHQLLQLPGTFAMLKAIEGHPGFFEERSSTMFNTKAILAHLPIHPGSSVTITRLQPSIPGVPSGTTTVPPTFMVCHIVLIIVTK